MEVSIPQNTGAAFTGMVLPGISSSILNTSRQEPKLFPPEVTTIMKSCNTPETMWGCGIHCLQTLSENGWTSFAVETPSPPTVPDFSNHALTSAFPPLLPTSLRWLLPLQYMVSIYTRAVTPPPKSGIKKGKWHGNSQWSLKPSISTAYQSYCYQIQFLGFFNLRSYP